MNIKEAREKLGLTQIDFALRLGLTRDHISKMERGVKPVQRQTELAIECLLRRAGLYEE